MPQADCTPVPFAGLRNHAREEVSETRPTIVRFRMPGYEGRYEWHHERLKLVTQGLCDCGHRGARVVADGDEQRCGACQVWLAMDAMRAADAAREAGR